MTDQTEEVEVVTIDDAHVGETERHFVMREALGGWVAILRIDVVVDGWVRSFLVTSFCVASP